MNVRRHNRPRLALGAALVIACVCALVSGATAASLATGSFQIGTVGETTSIPIVLDSAAGGLAGYRITVSLTDPSVATITAAAFPEWASLKSSSGLPAGQVLLQAVDLSQQVPMGGAEITLATLTVKGTAAGTTGIVITPDPSMGVQNRKGDLYPISVQPGTVTVGTASPGVLPTPLPTSGVTTPVSTIVVPTTIPPVVVPTPIITVIVPTPVTTGGSATPSPTSGGSTTVPISYPVYPAVPIGTSVPGAVSPGGSTGSDTPAVISPGVQPTFGAGKRYAIGNPGSFIGTRFGSNGTATGSGGSTSVTSPEATLKPGSRAYGLTPPTGKFVRWYPAARWKAGIK